MFRTAFCVGLIGLLLCTVAVSADTAGPAPASASAARARSSSKRVVWTLVGIGAGFGAGVLIGLHAFDDAINSDRKVWTSAIVGAAAGGLAGGLLGRNVGRAPQVKTTGPIRPVAELHLTPWTPARPSTLSDDGVLRRRVREISVGASLGGSR